VTKMIKVSRNPEPTVGCLIKLEDPISRQAVTPSIPLYDEQRVAVVVGGEAGRSRRVLSRPQSPLVILQRVMNVFVRQAIAPG